MARARKANAKDGTLGGFLGFVNDDLLPHLRALEEKPGATPRQKIVAEIMSGVHKTRIDTEKNFLDVIDAKGKEVAAAIAELRGWLR